MAQESNKKYNKLMIDAHLGRLCKLLRFAGIDCKSAQHLSEGAIISSCKRENRLFISRNKHLSAQIRTLPHLVLNETNIIPQLKEIRHSLLFNIEDIYTRCTICNNKLLPALIPSIRLQNMPEDPLNLKICTHCNHFYWEGTHYQKMRITLTDTLL
ncbi:MAG TPA: Mut7-C RNAse domain-containing protein [Candidatus Cloacimonadota bacterium]|nr:Mut7-C RNAse domain-containing protein [Candidatus Cloacimonadales bacterium]HPY95783.1 Mut7-C RNAse domain-containing protein [Candidatus Cloacimonadota bacterium]